MARELTREEKKKIRALVIKWCANYDKEYGCLPLECECYMFGKCWTGAYCRYFREAVLPLDPALEAALLTEGPRPENPLASRLSGAAFGVGRIFLWLTPGLLKCFPHLSPPLLDTLSRDAGHLRRCYSGGKSRLCNPAHNPV